MKHCSDQKILLMLSIFVCLLCWNGSMVDSNNNEKRPDTNVHGTITDHTETFDAQDIQFDKMIEKIPVYQNIIPTEIKSDKSIKPNLNPTGNLIPLDLHIISSIEACHPDSPIASELEINNRKYMEINVTFSNGSQKKCLIECSRVISCVQVQKSPNNNQQPVFISREIKMIHLEKLIIKGYKSTQDLSSTKQSQKNNESTEIATQTEKILDQLEQNVKNLPQEPESQYTKIKHAMVSLLQSLREQLQKMLHLIKN